MHRKTLATVFILLSVLSGSASGIIFLDMLAEGYSIEAVSRSAFYLLTAIAMTVFAIREIKMYAAEKRASKAKDESPKI